MSHHYISAPNQDFFKVKVWEFVKQIPPGKVATYGQVATLVLAVLGMDLDKYRGLGARWVGGAMAACPEGVPWQRVINAQGKISLPGRSGELQRSLLEEEGVQFDARGRINLKIYQWVGPGRIDTITGRLPGF